MSKFLETVELIYKKGGGYERMAEANAVLDTMFHMLEKSHPDLYKDTMYDLEKLAYEIETTEAEKIVKAMKPYGEKWSHDKIKTFLSGKGISGECTRWYLVMNMAYNDYHNTAEMVEKSEDAEFYFSLAKDFIHDKDQKPFKVERYFMN